MIIFCFWLVLKQIVVRCFASNEGLGALIAARLMVSGLGFRVWGLGFRV